MLKNAIKYSGMLMTAATLTVAASSVQGSGQLPIYEACLAKAESAPDRKVATDQCVWHHWDLMAEYGK
jgi:hypothetical protein